MGILQLPYELVGQSGYIPNKRLMVTTDSLATITTAGYLNSENLQGGIPVSNNTVIEMMYNYNTATRSGTYGIFTASVSNGVITLSQWVDAGNVLLPVISGNVAVFNGTTGQIKDGGAALSNNTDTVIPLFHGTATVGDFVTVNNANKTIQDSGSAPSAASQPFVVVSPGSLTSGHVAKFNDANGTVADAGFAASNVLISSVTNPDTAGDIFWVPVALTAAGLASSGHITIQASSGSKQYKVRDVRVRYSASGLSGGGGNRLVNITDGTTIYNNAGITAALLGTPINTVWAGTGNPLPGTVDMDTATAAGATLYAVYAGGSADYTTGTVNIDVCLERVA